MAAARAHGAGHHHRPRRRLLVVNRYFHPDDHAATGQLLADLVGALDGDGRFAVTVFAGRQRYDDPAAAPLPARERLATGARVRRLWATRCGRARLAGRALDYATFYLSALVALLAMARPGDVILAKTDPPLISVVAWLVARLRGARLVNWCQDLFPEAAAALGVRPAGGVAGRLLRALRNRSLGGALLNVAVCDGMAARLRAEGVPAARIAVIHNWADGASVRPLAPADNPLRRAWGLDADRFVIGHSGNLGRAHDVEAVLGLVDTLRDEPGITFLFIGGGAGLERLRRSVAVGRGGAPNVLFRPYQPRARLGLSLTAPDLHLVALRPACEGLVMPSKLYGILAAGRPVLFLADPGGDTARIVREWDAGLVAAPGADVAALAARVRGLRRDRAAYARMAANARRAHDAAFDRTAGLAAWVGHLGAVAGAPAAAPVAGRDELAVPAG